MTAQVVPMTCNRIGVQAALTTWQAAGRYLDFSATGPVEIALACASRDEATRLAVYINLQAAGRADKGDRA